MRPYTHLGLLVAVSVSLVLSIAACSTASEGSDDGTPGGDAGDGNGANRPDATTSGQAGDRCKRAGECRGALVCDPISNECADSISCASHGDCGLGAHCAERGECAKSRTGSPCADEDNCKVADACLDGVCACRDVEFETERVDLNVLVLLDRSFSMDSPLDGSTRWRIALDAIDRLLDTYGERIRFGLALYPQESTACGPGEVLVPVQPGARSQINGELESSGPGGLTPSGPSLANVGQHPPLHDADRENAILYVTDGQENCGEAPDQVEAAGNLLSQGIRTFVVGFTEDVKFAELNATAEAGGTAREGASDGRKFYLATDAATLNEAFAAIAGENLACTYGLGDTPTDPDHLVVYVDGQTVSRDRSHQNGWDLDEEENRITFYGPACDDHLAGAAVEVAVVQECDPVIID